MPTRNPINELPTHRISNQAIPLENYNLFEIDRPLQEAIGRNEAEWAESLMKPLVVNSGLRRRLNMVAWPITISRSSKHSIVLDTELTKWIFTRAITT